MGADLGIKLSNLIDTCHAGTPATSVELQVHKSTLCFTGRSLRNSGRAGAEVVPAGARAPPYSPPRGRRPGRRLDAARHSPDRRGTARRGIKPRADSVDSGATAPARRSIEPPDTPSLAAAGASAGQGGGGGEGEASLRLVAVERLNRPRERHGVHDSKQKSMHRYLLEFHLCIHFIVNVQQWISKLPVISL